MKTIPKKIKILCKKYHIRLSVKKKSKRVKKSLCVLLRELKKKIKNQKKSKKRSKFGEGEEPEKKSKCKK